MRKNKKHATARVRKSATQGTVQTQETSQKQEDFIMLPTVDFCFKELMQNPNIRKNIIAALLNVPSNEVDATELMPTILPKESKDDKYGILDVRVKLKDGKQMDLEMQVESYEYWANRTVYYLSKMYASQIREGEGYDKLKKCIHVSILDYVYFPKDKECYRTITFCDKKTGKEYTDLMEMHILELGKLPPEQKDETSLLQWMRFLAGKNKKELAEMAKKNSELEEAYKELEKLSADEKKRIEYEARQKHARDYKIGMLSAEMRGEARGEARGREAGKKEERDRMNQLIIRLTELNRTEDIIKAATDSEYQQKLFEEFGL